MTDRRALFESLYMQHEPMVRQMCMGFMEGDRALASDLTQDVFINIWNALPAFKGDSTPKTWIYRITVNTCLQHLRKKTPKNISLPDNFDVRDETSAQHSDDTLSLYRAIGALSEMDRLIIMMVLEELDYDEIAKVVGIENTNLRVKIHRIKKRLKELLEYAK